MTGPLTNSDPPEETAASPTPSQVALTADDLDLLVFCEQHWNLHGQLPTLERAEELGVSKDLYHKTLLKSDFQTALAERGIVLRSSSQGFKARTLTAEQLAVANTLLDLTDTRSQKKKLQDLGIPTVKYNAWLKDPVFHQYLRDRAENVLGDHSHEANLALIDSVRAGNIKAIEFYMELTGRYISPSKLGNRQGSNVDVHGIIVSIIEIIQQEVTDAAVQAKIGDRLMNLIKANQTAAALTASQEPPVGEPLTPSKPQLEAPAYNHPLEGLGL